MFDLPNLSNSSSGYAFLTYEAKNLAMIPIKKEDSYR